MTIPLSLQGKRAIVTGGSRGIGAAIVQRLLEAGARVVTTARSSTPNLPNGATFITGDVGTLKGVEALVAAALKQLGGVDILVNNAAAARAFPAGSSAIPDAEWQNSLEVNFLSAVRMTSGLLPGMLERKSGVIVNISSGVAQVPPGALLHYAAAKSALLTYSKGLATEVAPRGVRVNVVTPGNVETPGADLIRRHLADAFDLKPDALVAGIPLGRNGVPNDIANAVLFLVSDAAAWVTGSNFVIDGGQNPTI